MKNITSERFRSLWARDRIICRLLAAWSWFAVLVLARNGGNFANLSYAQSTPLWQVALWTFGSFGVFGLFTAVAFFAHPYHSDSWFLVGGATVCVWIWMVNAPTGESGVLFWIATTVIYALFVLFAVQVNHNLLDRLRPSRRVAVYIAIGAATVSCVVISVITCLRYKTFSSPNYDFGLFVNMFHNMRETGLPMITSERDRLLSHFAVHVSPIYYLLLPVYFIFPSPLTLQIGQAVALMLGIIPVLLLAKHFKLSTKATIAVSLLYAFYPALSTGCFYDIHENCFLPLFLLLTFYFFETKRPLPMYLSAVCVLMVKEDAAVYILIFAIYLLLSKRNYLHGGLLALLACGWFAGTAVLLEKFGTGMMVNRFDNLIYNKEDGLLGVIKTALVNPGYVLTQMFTTYNGTWDKIVYFLQLFLPLGFLPFCTKRVSRWLLVAPVLMNLITYYQYQYHLGFQYHFGIAAFLIYAMLQNLPELSVGWRRSFLGIAVAGCLCLYVFEVIPTYNSYVNRWQENKEQYARMEKILDTVPEDASVNCSTFLLAHIADRDEIYEIAYHGDKPDVDYVVIDARYRGWQETAETYLAQGYEYELSEENLIVILKRIPST